MHGLKVIGPMPSQPRKTLQEKQDEKGRLSRAYKARKREQWKALFEQEPRLADFKKALRREENPARILKRLQGSWIMSAPDDVRYAALQIIDAHANRMILRRGGQILDDPLPPKRNLFLVAREMLRVR